MTRAQVYDKFPLYIDRELHEPLKRIFDLKAIHSSETSFSAEGYRKFNRYEDDPSCAISASY